MANIISLGGLQVASRDELGQAMAGGCTASSCGTKAGPADMDPATWAKVKDHPCYSEEAHQDRKSVV